MTSPLEERSLLTEVELVLQKKFNKDANATRVPSTARAADGSRRLDQLVLPDTERAKMPFTKDKYLVKENPHLVQWERETRKFLRQLSPIHGHRVAAVMIYEWATGISMADMVAAELANPDAPKVPWRSDLRKINQCLRFYFGKPYMTYIMGRKIPKAYRVKPGWYVKRHRPMTLTLYAEYMQKTLNP